MIPKKTDFDGNRKLFFDSFLGLKTIQTLQENKKKKPPFNITKIVHLPGGIYPDAEIPEGVLYDRSSWIPSNYIKRMEEFNLAGACISLTINETDGKGRKKENIIKIRSLFADFDGQKLPVSWELEPSMIVETSPGKYHVYWFVDDFPVELFSQIQENIAYRYKTDTAMKDITRALRIPGFYHQKKARFLVRIIQHTGLRYNANDFNIFPPKPVKQWSAPKWRTTNVEHGEYKGTYGVAEGGRNHHLVKVAGGMIRAGRSLDYIHAELHKEGFACTPPVCEQEIESVFKSIRRYVRG